MKKQHQTHCCWPGCEEEGKYRAPISPQKLHEYTWYCLPHIRQYNASWNFFKYMSTAEMEAFTIDAAHGHRPTWKMGVDADRIEHAIRTKIARSRGWRFTSAPSHPQLPSKERRALRIMGLEMPTTVNDIKRTYKKLVKQYHPDVNGDCKEAEEMFKKISEAYSVLCNSNYFNG